ncbi:hypothetical protein FA047_01830 [Pedobacter frigoris]|uniref:Uncharacterized protein n=1 Tax=Pedobacter frigoris TaxID=2571272 RepID=A0A4U1CM00_9SPHI|nr:hypothetical protein FA047_01830 [Pedobacter frigoris]
MFGKEVNGDWKFLDQAKLTHTDGVPEGRSDYAGGISPDHSDHFYMSSGGYEKTINPGTVMVKAKGKIPRVDLKALEKTLVNSPKSSQ